MNNQIPIIVLYGPPQSGRTITLIRLSRFLRDNGYYIRPVRSFRPPSDSHYQRLCDDFPGMIHSYMVQDSAALIQYMLVEVLDKSGRPICQILEIPGQCCIDPRISILKYPSFFNNIITSPNPKMWCIFIEPDTTSYMMEREDRLNYVENIKKLATTISSRDKVTIVFNKIDQSETMLDAASVKTSLAIVKAKIIYPGLFEIFANENPITKWWKPTRADFVPYMNGCFTPVQAGGFSFQLGHDNFPRSLWKIIRKFIK